MILSGLPIFLRPSKTGQRFANGKMDEIVYIFISKANITQVADLQECSISFIHSVSSPGSQCI
jgi:hypothetical protein